MIKLKDIINENKAPLNEAQMPFPSYESIQVAAKSLGLKPDATDDTLLSDSKSYDEMQEHIQMDMTILMVAADIEARKLAVAKKQLKPEDFDGPNGDKIGLKAGTKVANELQIMFGKLMNEATKQVKATSKELDIDKDAPKGFWDTIKQSAKKGWDAGKADADSIRKQYGGTAKNPETAGKGMFGNLFK